MFLQPMLLIEELRRFPYSLCTDDERAPSLQLWTDFLESLERLVDKAPLSDELLQQIIISVRSWNNQRTWSDSYGVSRYQTVARAIQEPAKWETLSKEDRDSMDDYIQYTLSHTLGDGNVCSDRMFAKLHEAHDKIRNPAIRRAIDEYMEADMARWSFLDPSD